MRDYNSAWALLARMRSLRHGPIPRTFAILAERYVSAEKPHRAVNLFLSMHNYGCRQDLHSFNTILDILCKSKRVEMAHDLFKTLRNKFNADSISYNIIANCYCIVKRTPMAYNTMMKGYFRNKQLESMFCILLDTGDESTIAENLAFRYKFAEGDHEQCII
ncbi:pentatricopeptide repeat-containing protein At1g74900, mitochondrial isoform X2 [Cajanus cajan]|uniref:pentatricopeptide repeat-containing protein At1g74900, mitochondrial isoform X2 n=1 Tax=Cajanus cajan TaxID=3821 RepID=UPI00098DA62E|nr:pentatricopeptide repeat-containing protein At1g74900, mitochondrial isoform X2 [Cajanus cajan]